MADTDYRARAEREAANIIAEAGVQLPVDGLELLTTLVGLAWLHGHKVGTEETMAEAERAFKQLAADLAAAIPV